MRELITFWEQLYTSYESHFLSSPLCLQKQLAADDTNPEAAVVGQMRMLEVCPETYMGEEYDPPFHSRAFRTDCNHTVRTTFPTTKCNYFHLITTTWQYFFFFSSSYDHYTERLPPYSHILRRHNPTGIVLPVFYDQTLHPYVLIFLHAYMIRPSYDNMAL